MPFGRGSVDLPEIGRFVSRSAPETRPRPARLGPRITALFSAETPLTPADCNGAKLYTLLLTVADFPNYEFPGFFRSADFGPWSPEPEPRLPGRGLSLFGSG